MLVPDNLERVVWLCLDINDVAMGRVLLLDVVLDLCKELVGNGIAINLRDLGAEVLHISCIISNFSLKNCYLISDTNHNEPKFPLVNRTIIIKTRRFQSTNPIMRFEYRIRFTRTYDFLIIFVNSMNFLFLLRLTLAFTELFDDDIVSLVELCLLHQLMQYVALFSVVDFLSDMAVSDLLNESIHKGLSRIELCSGSTELNVFILLGDEGTN